MKKKLILLTMVLGLVGLSSCTEDNKVSYVDETGKKVTFELAETDDTEVLNNVINYVSKANYSNYTSYKFEYESDFNLDFTDNNYDVFTSFDFVESVDVISGSNCDVSLDLSVGKSITNSKNDTKVNGNVNIYIDNLVSSSKDAFLYFNAIGSVNSDEINKNISKKMKMSQDTIMTCLNDISNSYGQIISEYLEKLTQIPSIPNENLGDISEFKKKYSNSSLSISDVSKKNFTLSFDLSLSDIIKNSNTQYSFYSGLINKDIKANLDIVCLKNGVISKVNFNFEFNDFELVNALGMYISNSNYKDIIKKFASLNYSFSLGVLYDISFPILSDDVKNDYELLG